MRQETLIRIYRCRRICHDRLQQPRAVTAKRQSVEACSKWNACCAVNGVAWCAPNRSEPAWAESGRACSRMEQEKAVISMSPEESSEICREGINVGSGGFTSDAVTVAQLRSRVEQQSSLIAMLKQRNDETFKEVR